MVEIKKDSMALRKIQEIKLGDGRDMGSEGVGGDTEGGGEENQDSRRERGLGRL